MGSKRDKNSLQSRVFDVLDKEPNIAQRDLKAKFPDANGKTVGTYLTRYRTQKNPPPLVVKTELIKIVRSSRVSPNSKVLALKEYQRILEKEKELVSSDEGEGNFDPLILMLEKIERDRELDGSQKT